MIERLVSLGLEHRRLAILAFLLLATYGAYSWTELAVEAYPDVSDTAAQVITQHPGHAAEEVEEQVTVPLERALNGIPGRHVMRSRSTFGLSLITLVFRDGVEDYWARQRVRERLAGVSLPAGAESNLDPLTSPAGEIFRYTLESPNRGPRELRDLQQWVVIPALRQVFGVADVSNFGGEATQFQLILDPARLIAYGLSLRQVVEAIRSNNQSSGGSLMVRGDQAFVVRGTGLLRSLADLGSIVVTQKNGTPILLSHLGRIELGTPWRRGILGKNDNPDAVSGILLLLRGENPSAVLTEVHRKVHQLNHGLLPSDVRVVPYLNRTDLVQTTVHTVSRTLLEGMVLVALVLGLFLGSLRGALIVAVTIPLSLLTAFILMHHTNIPANLLSLGVIDFGIIVNGAIIMLEIILRRRETRPEGLLSVAEAREAATQVARPMFFAMAIIITAYLPLFAFQRVEKKLFTPMAYTIGYSLVASVLVALALTPGLALWAYRRPRRTARHLLLTWLGGRYDRALTSLLRCAWRTILGGLVAAALGLVLTLGVGKAFLPELDEGSIWLQVTLPPGISLAKASTLAGELRRAVREFPEVENVVTQTGRVDDDMDPWTPSHMECAVTLRPYDTWPPGETKTELVARLKRRLARIPGMTVSFSQPIIDMVNDKIAGAHSELVVKVFGAELDELRRIAAATAQVLRQIPGATDVAVDQEPPIPQLQVEVDRTAAARFGINVVDLAELIELGVGGRAVDQILIAERRYDIAIRLTEESRSSPEAIGDLLLATSSRARIPLSQVAHLTLRSGESTITREGGRRHLTVKLNLQDHDLASFLRAAQARVGREVHFDSSRYDLVWGGQFENQRRAEARLAIIAPLVLCLIFLLLFAAFGTLRHAALVMACVPLALLGGMAGLLLRGMTLNVSSAVGFIALFGVAVQNGVLLVDNLRRTHAQGLPLLAAIRRGAAERLRPVLMTATVATLGLLPAALARGIGSDVQRPLATVVVCGILTSTVLTLLVLPALYLVVERRTGAAILASDPKYPAPAAPEAQ